MAERLRDATSPYLLQGLIHAASQARAEGLAAVPAEIAAPLINAFRHGVILGLGQVKKADGRKHTPCRQLLECPRERRICRD